MPDLPQAAPLTRAPWSEDQVLNLAERQLAGLHPYTCNGDPGSPGPSLHRTVSLIPTPEGWVCQLCPFTQDWAHAMDANLPGWWKRGDA